MKWSVRIFFLYVLLLPTQLTKHFWPSWAFVQGFPVDYLSPTLYFTDFVFFGMLAFWAWESKLNISRSTKILFLSIIAVLLGALVGAISPASLIFALRLTQAVVLFLFVRYHAWQINRQIHKPLVASLVYLNVISIWQLFVGGSVGGLFYWLGERNFRISTPGIARFSLFGTEYMRPYATLPHPNVLAAYAVMSTLMLYAITKRKYVLVLMVVPLFLTQSLSALLALLLGAMFLVFNKYIKTKIPFFIIVFSLLLPFTNTYLKSDNVSISRRAILYEASMKSVDNIFFGSGIGVSIPHISYLSREYSIDSRWFLQPVHNIVMIVFVESGYFGVLVLFTLMQLLLSKAVTIESKVYTYALLFVFFTMLFDHYWWTSLQARNLAGVFFGLLFNVHSAKIQSR